MNVGVIGIFSNDLNGLSGAFLYSLSHGFASSALFLLAGHLYDRYHTKTLKYCIQKIQKDTSFSYIFKSIILKISIRDFDIYT